MMDDGRRRNGDDGRVRAGIEVSPRGHRVGDEALDDSSRKSGAITQRHGPRDGGQVRKRPSTTNSVL